MRNHPLIAPLLLSLCLLSACHSTSPAPTQRYTLTGKVESVDKSTQTINVDGDAIPGFMSAMSMPYKVKNPDEIKPLKTGDSISATLIKQDDEYLLEGVHVTKSASPPANAATR